MKIQYQTSWDGHEVIDAWLEEPDGFSLLKGKKSKRCRSCRELIGVGSIVLEFERYRLPKTEVEEKIYHGDAIKKASWCLCEHCGDLYFEVQNSGEHPEVGSRLFVQAIAAGVQIQRACLKIRPSWNELSVMLSEFYRDKLDSLEK